MQIVNVHICHGKVNYIGLIYFKNNVTIIVLPITSRGFIGIVETSRAMSTEIESIQVISRYLNTLIAKYQTKKRKSSQERQDNLINKCLELPFDIQKKIYLFACYKKKNSNCIEHYFKKGKLRTYVIKNVDRLSYSFALNDLDVARYKWLGHLADKLRLQLCSSDIISTLHVQCFLLLKTFYIQAHNPYYNHNCTSCLAFFYDRYATLTCTCSNMMELYLST